MNFPHLRSTAEATLLRFGTKAEALKRLKLLHLGPEVQAVRNHTKFGAVWLVHAVPVGDPGEARLLLTEQNSWIRVCAVSCFQLEPGARHCHGHPMNAEESHELTVAICGHHTRVYRFGTTREVRGFDWRTGRDVVDHMSAGDLYRARCVCGWKSSTHTYKTAATGAAEAHRREYGE